MNDINLLPDAFAQRPLIACMERERTYAPRAGRPSALLASSQELVGIELELEDFRANHVQMEVLLRQWQQHEEGSLVNGTELVLHPPRNGSDVDESINMFFGAKVKYTGGERTSTHIHVDMMDGTTVGEFRSVMALVYMLEGAIYRIADENRKWGSYSCPITDMSPTRFSNIFTSNQRPVFQRGLQGKKHEDKYYGCNAVSIRKHGTLEFRYFPCAMDKETLYSWVNLCLELKLAGKMFACPSALTAALSSGDELKAFVRRAMPLSAESLLRYLDEADALERSAYVLALCNDADAVRVNPDNEEPRKTRGIEKFLKLRAERNPAPKRKAPVAMDDFNLIPGKAPETLGEWHELLLRQQQAVRRARMEQEVEPAPRPRQVHGPFG